MITDSLIMNWYAPGGVIEATKIKTELNYSRSYIRNSRGREQRSKSKNKFCTHPRCILVNILIRVSKIQLQYVVLRKIYCFYFESAHFSLSQWARAFPSLDSLIIPVTLTLTPHLLCLSHPLSALMLYILTRYTLPSPYVRAVLFMVNKNVYIFLISKD